MAFGRLKEEIGRQIWEGRGRSRPARAGIAAEEKRAGVGV
jgi:hypothetical protein